MKPLAAFTIVRNDGFFLRRWLEYYGRIPGVSLHVLDHQSDDGSTDNLPPRVTRKVVEHPEAERAHWMLVTVQDYFRHLLASGFKRVIFAEADEFLVPDPARWSSLGEFLDSSREGEIAATGMSVVYHSGDPPLPESGSLLVGRHWMRDERYDMTLISSSVPPWKLGRHGLEGRPNGPHAGLVLVHLHYADPQIGWDRMMARRRGKPPAPDGCGTQNKFATREEFDAHWGAMCGGGSAASIPENYTRVL